MYVNRVVGPLVALQASRGSGHRLVVLGADDDDDEILFLRQEKITTGSKLLQLSNFFMQQVHTCRTSWVPRCENDFLCRQITQFKLFSFHLIIMKEFHRQFAFFFFFTSLRYRSMKSILLMLLNCCSKMSIWNKQSCESDSLTLRRKHTNSLYILIV